MIEGATGLWELIERRAALTPDALLAVDEHDRTLAFGDLRDRAERVAAGLAARFGLAVGDHVSWLLPTWIESIVLVGALARLGVVQNPMLPIYREREVGFIADQTHATLLVTPSTWKGFAYDEMAAAVAAARPGLRTLVCDRDRDLDAGDLPDVDPSTLAAPLPPPAAAADAPVRWIFYTSGTTAEPKGARHTDRSVLAASLTMIDGLGITGDDNVAMVFPFSHIGGQVWLFSSLLTGARLVLTEAFVAAETIPMLTRHDITVAGAGTPFHMAYLAAQREHPDVKLFPNVRVFPGGASPKPPQLHYDIKAEMGGVGIISSYGLTECPVFTFAHLDDPDEELAYTEGRPDTDQGVELRVVTLDGHIAGPKEEGELRVKAPHRFRGYVDSSLDADAFDEEGFFRTGDLGLLDDRGNVVITGRLKDIIIRKGENISAKEVEDALFAHPRIADAAVIGLPDPQSGERACAVIVTATPGEAPTLAELYEYLTAEAGLMVQKVPEQLEIVDELPRNPTGKVLKHELRARYTD